MWLKPLKKAAFDPSHKCDGINVMTLAKMLNKFHEVQECDTTNDDSSSERCLHSHQLYFKELIESKKVAPNLSLSASGGGHGG